MLSFVLQHPSIAESDGATVDGSPVGSFVYLIRPFKTKRGGVHRAYKLRNRHVASCRTGLFIGVPSRLLKRDVASWEIALSDIFW